MPVIQTRLVSCSDCATETEFLRNLGLTVLGCSPTGGPGECQISFFDPRLASAEGAALPASPDAAALPGAAALATALPGSLTPTQARTCKAILNLFETGDVVGLYGSVTVLPGDTGQLTFGRSQTTLGSGNLALLIERYAGNPAARFGRRLAALLPRLQARDASLNDDEHLKNILRASADDPVMRDVQDDFFDDQYWQPALRACKSLGISTALGSAVVYDSHIQGSWKLIRDRTTAALGGAPQQVGEQRWISGYVQARHEWLATHSNTLLRKTVYRMDAFARLIALGNWGLALPIVVLNREVSLQTMSGLPLDAFDSPAPGTRPLALASPMLKGLDVRLLQLGLSELGVDVRADAIYGQASRDAVIALQRRQGLPATGTLDAAEVLRLAAK
ncbi:MAG: chitosanase [Burkholderiales bacterium]|nr:MAG: chitosanase [Burkholderiales bacterium]